jgi:hypothetical protein
VRLLPRLGLLAKPEPLDRDFIQLCDVNDRMHMHAGKFFAIVAGEMHVELSSHPARCQPRDPGLKSDRRVRGAAGVHAQPCSC